MSTRRLVPLLAVASVAVLVAGVAVVATSEPVREDVLQAQAPQASEPSASPVAVPTAAPSPPPPATAEQPAGRAPRAQAPAPAPKRPAPAAQPDPERAPDDGSGYGAAPGAVVHPYDPGRRTYSVTTQGVTLTATFSTMTPKTGELVDVRLSGRAEQPACCSLIVQYGDGGDDSRQIPNDGSCATTASYAPRHAWNRPGRVQLQLQAGAAGCGQDERYALMRVWVDVAPGAPAVSNGPSKPTVAFDIERNPSPNDPGRLHFWGKGEDRDGYVGYFVLDPGDGSKPFRINGVWQGRCRSDAGGYAIGTTAYLPNDPPPSYRYAEPGTYTATLTVHSTGCDGKHVQTAAATYTHSF